MARGYLFSDIDGSTQKWERSGAAMQAAMMRHDQIFAELIAAHGGFIHDQAGDGVFAIFTGGDPLACALALQLALEREPWTGIDELRVRLGVHVGPNPTSLWSSEASGGVAERIAANRTARIAASAWGGQIIVSADAVAAFGVPALARLVDLGAVALKGVEAPMRLYGLAHADLKQTAFPPLRLQEGAQGNLPTPSGRLIGRVEELEILLGLIARPQAGRLINLVGPAGAGKTRLAQEAVRRIGETRAVLYLPIDTVGEGDDFLRLLARALGLALSGEGYSAQAVAEVLRTRGCVVVFDNVERARAGALQRLTRLVETCPDLVVVCVSRSPIECVCVRQRLAGLPQPAPSLDGVRTSAAYELFQREAQRAGAVLCDDEHSALHFQKLCAAVSGLPLALQLSANWLRHLTLEAIVARVTIPGGHDLSVIFADTWAALAPDLRCALAGLSLFRAPFSGEAADMIAGAGQQILMALEDRGLLERAADRRFVLHPLVADLARAMESAGMAGARAAHARYFLSHEMLGPQPRGGVGAPIADIEQAWGFARRTWSPEAVKDAGERLFYWCAFAGYFLEGAQFFQPLGEGEPHAIGAYNSALRANCLFHAHQIEVAQSLARASAQAVDDVTRAHGLHALANMAHGQGDFAEAQDYYEQALALRLALQDHMGAHYTSTSLAALALARGETDAASGYLLAAFAHARNHPIALIHTYFYAGEVALAQERHEDAHVNFMRALELDALVEHAPFRTRLLLRMGALAGARGDGRGARDAYDEAANLARALGDLRGAAFAAVEVGLVALDEGDLQRAKAEITAAVRHALELRSKPLVARALLGLLRVEIAAGDVDAALRLRRVLEDADLGALRASFETIAGGRKPNSDEAPTRAPASVLDEGARVVLRL